MKWGRKEPEFFKSESFSSQIDFPLQTLGFITRNWTKKVLISQVNEKNPWVAVVVDESIFSNNKKIFLLDRKRRTARSVVCPGGDTLGLGCTCSPYRCPGVWSDCSRVCVCECDCIVANVSSDNVRLGWLMLCQEWRGSQIRSVQQSIFIRSFSSLQTQ